MTQLILIPGTSTVNLISAGGADIFILKLDAAGNFVWVKQLGGYAGDYGYAIELDAAGNVYITSDFGGKADFDPGSGVFHITSAGSQDVFVTKLNAFGDLVWARNMGGAYNDHGNGLAVDAAGSVYSIGYFKETADFNPGSGLVNFTHTNSQGFLFQN